MDEITSQTNQCDREHILENFPCFAILDENKRKLLLTLFSEIQVAPKTPIVIENDLVDSIYIILKGEAEVSIEKRLRRKIKYIPVAIIQAGEAIGLNHTGFFSASGKRTATVTSITEMTLLKLNVSDLHQFLQQHQLEHVMYQASANMLKMKFIRQSLPFAKISHQRLQWLIEHITETHIEAGTVLFNQGDRGDKCYLVRAGEIEIVHHEVNGEEQLISVLKPPVLFGEATLISDAPRNATARARTPCDLLVLEHRYLSELIESEAGVANMFMTLMVDRSRPMRNSAVTLHQRTAADGQVLAILKNTANNSYFKLSKEGMFVWRELDGKKTLHEITLDLAEQYNVFAPDMVVALISKLAASGFIENLGLHHVTAMQKTSRLLKVFSKFSQWLNYRVSFGDVNQWLNKSYQRYVRFLFTKPGLTILSLLAIFGIAAFVANTANVLLFFSVKHASLILLLTLLPLGLIEVVLHELGHAYTVKYFGHEVHYMGIGWSWGAPIAFTDTSDMWLAVRRPRLFVNLAGIAVDLVVAGIAALLIYCVENPYIQGMLWLFALYTYIGAFRMLNPLQDMDGYYALMDWVEKSKLRQASVLWLVRQFPKALRKPRLFREARAEVTYWISCLVYLVLVTLLTLIVQIFVFTIVGIESFNPYIALALPFCVAILTSLSIVAEIRSQAENE